MTRKEDVLTKMTDTDNFEGVQTAMEFVKDDPRLKFVSMLQNDTLWDNSHKNFKIKLSVFKTFPEKEHPETTTASNSSIIVKQSPFVTSLMSGSIMLAFTTKEIIESKWKIRLTSLIVSLFLNLTAEQNNAPRAHTVQPLPFINSSLAESLPYVVT